MILKKLGFSAAVLLLLSTMLGCVSTATPSPTPSATPAPTPSEIPSPTPLESEGFSIYLLVDDMPATELAAVALSDLQLQQEPIVSVKDIVAYSRETHELELTAEAYERIQQLFTLPVEVRGMPFVVCVGTDRIYSGAFMTPASSISFDGVVIIEPFDVDRHVISIALGYPSPEAFTGKDPRSDPRVFESLEARGKLR